MKLKGTVEIPADRATVFAFLTDPDRIGPCLPKVESVKKRPDGTFEATAKVGKGFLSATLVMHCSFTENVPPERAAIRATGKAKGSAVDGTARMELVELPDDAGTRVDWTADVELSGIVAKLAGNRFDAKANDLVEQTFRKVKKRIKSAG